MSSDLCINPQPITKKGIQEHNPQIHCIYTGKRGNIPLFHVAREKPGGSALGAIYQRVRASGSSSPKPPRDWLGKIGYPTGRLRDDPATFGSRTKKEINLDTIREKLAYDLYQEFGRGIFRVPKTRLSPQKVLDEHTRGDSVEYARELLRLGVAESLRIMSCFIEGYQDFSEVSILEESSGIALGFIDYLQNRHSPPRFLLTPDGKPVPLSGLMGLLAVGRVLGDTDVIGGDGRNAGFVWAKDSTGQIVAAEVYKIDPGESFNFKLEDPDRRGRLSFSKNWLVNTRSLKEGKEIGGGNSLENEKDLQIAQRDSRITIKWSCLSGEQKDEFLATLFNCSRYLRTKEILKYLFYRDGKFNRSPLEQIPEKTAEDLQKELQAWLELQLTIYQEDLLEFKSRHPEQVLRAEYIDRWGELPLPASDRTFPIRELFTQLTLVEANTEPKSSKSSPSELPERDSLIETLEKMDRSPPAISLETLFDPREKKPTRKVLLLGRAGIGKSTICQKIAHDWASGRLWPGRYKAIFWLPLRDLNGAVEEGGFLYQEKDVNLFLAKAVAHIRLKDASLIDSLVHLIQTHRQEIIIIPDGWDEASPLLIQALELLLHHPELNILLTSRPGVTEPIHRHMDRIVENIGFSQEQTSQYVEHFFGRVEEKKDIALAKKEKFLAAIEKERNLYAIAHIPLILQMLCVQWESGAEQVGFASSLAGLYSDMVTTLFQWQCRKEGTDPYAVSEAEKVDVLSVLGRIGLTGLREGRLIIPGQLVGSVLQTTRIPERSLLRTGLLRASGEGVTREFCFLHLTFQEYVIAFSITLKSPAEQKAFIVEHRCKPQFQLVLALMAGIIDRQDPTKEKLKAFFDHLHTAPGDLTGFYQLALTLRCLQQCTDSVIQDWIEEKYYVYNSLVKVPELAEKRKEFALELSAWFFTLINYLKGSEKIFVNISIFLVRSGPPFGEKFISDWIAKLPYGKSWYELFEFALKYVHDFADGNLFFGYIILSTLCETCPPEHAFEVFESLQSVVPNQNSKIDVFGFAVDSKAIWYSMKPQLEQTLLYKFSSVQWNKAFKAFQPYFEHSVSDVRENAVKYFEAFCDSCPPDMRQEVLKILLQLLRDPDTNIRKSLAVILQRFCERYPSAHWHEALEVFRQDLGDLNNDILQDAECALQSLCEKCPPDQWQKIFKSLTQNLSVPESKVRKKTARILKVFCQNHSSDQWSVVFETFLRALGDSESEIREIAVESLRSLCEKCPSKRWNEPLVFFQKAFKDSESGVRMSAAGVLQVLCNNCPSERWNEVLVVFHCAFNDSESEVRKIAVESLRSLCEKCPPERWNEALVFFQKAFRDSESEVRMSAAALLEVLFENCLIEKWKEVLVVFKQALGDANRDVRVRASDSLNRLCEKCPVEQWVETFETLRQGFVHLSFEADEAEFALKLEFIKRLTHDQWYSIFEAICVALNDSKWPASDGIKRALKILCQQCPSEQWQKAFKILPTAFKDPSDSREVLKILCQRCPSEQWYTAFTIYYQELETSNQRVQRDSEIRLELLNEICSPDQWSRAFAFLRHAIVDPVRQGGIRAARVLRVLCKNCPSECWHRAFIDLYSMLTNLDSYVKNDAAHALLELCKKSPPSQWHEAYPVVAAMLKHEDFLLRSHAVVSLGTLCSICPNQRWQEVFETLLQVLMDFPLAPDTLNLENTEKALIMLCESCPLDQWLNFFESLRRALWDQDVNVRTCASHVLTKLCEKCPTELWSEVFEIVSRTFGIIKSNYRSKVLSCLCRSTPAECGYAILEVLFKVINSTESDILENAREALERISLKSFVEHLQITPKYLGFFLTQLGARKSPLYINRLPSGQLRLACIENNQEVSREISEDEFKAIKTSLQTDHPLSSYIAQYIGQESFNLQQLTEWLNLKFPQNWQTQEKDGIVYLENPGADNLLISRALAGLGEVVDDLGLEDLRISKEKRQITIQGKAEDIEKLLEGLVAESKDAMQ